MTAAIEQTPNIDVRADHPGRNPHLHAGLVALAEYLTGLDEYPDPWEMFHAFLPWRTREQIEEDAPALLREVVARHAGTASDFDVTLAAEYLTGARS